MFAFPSLSFRLPRSAAHHARATALAALLACHGGANEHRTGPSSLEAGAPARATSPAALGRSVEATLRRQRLSNVVAYIPPQCFTKTLPVGTEAAKNPCYVCHGHSTPPNFNDDGDFQLSLLLPPAAAANPWTNLFAPPITTAPRTSDQDVLRYVRTSNYLDGERGLLLTRALEAPPDEWDINGNSTWDGYKPDVWFHFDSRGFDHRPDGTASGWRAFGYYPFPGTFFPTNGSSDDVLIRLDPKLQKDLSGHYDQSIYELNLAVVEALVTRSDVSIDPVDERVAGWDLDLDGRLSHASRVVFDTASTETGATRMHYAGMAGEEQRAGRLATLVGLFPAGTEFFHTVRYLDVDAGGVTMAPRMKELRYAKKMSYLDYATLRGRAALDAREQALSRDATRHVNWQGERGIDNNQGWVFQGFIEDEQGALRPQSREEMTYCAGCHGGIGATTDSIFSFPRKLGAPQIARGWFHWSQRDLRGIPEPKRSDGQYEYTMYLQQAGAGDEFRENAEVLARFFDARLELRPNEVSRLHDDISRLLLPSAERALDLDRAYRAVVTAQAFARGRDAILAPSRNVHETVPVGEPTGIRAQVALARLVRGANQ